MVLLSAGLTGCTSAKATDLMTGVQPGDRKTSIDVTGPEAAAVTDFAVRLLQNLPSGEENTLLSPVSVLCALAMTENGAKGYLRRNAFFPLKNVLGAVVNTSVTVAAAEHFRLIRKNV